MSERAEALANHVKMLIDDKAELEARLGRAAEELEQRTNELCDALGITREQWDERQSVIDEAYVLAEQEKEQRHG